MTYSNRIGNKKAPESRITWNEVAGPAWAIRKSLTSTPGEYFPDEPCWPIDGVPLFKDSSTLLYELGFSIEDTLACLKRFAVMISNSEEIRKYLFEFPDMIDLVRKICRRARVEFGLKPQLILVVYHDPEINDHYLALLVRSNAYDTAFVNDLDLIADEFAAARIGKSGWMTISTDFKPAEV